MANLITNKHKKLDHDKKPAGFQKLVSARKLRRGATAEIGDAPNLPATRPSKHSDRKRSGSCPICLGRLAKNSRGTRYVRAAIIAPPNSCRNCAAVAVALIAFGVVALNVAAKAVATSFRSSCV